MRPPLASVPLKLGGRSLYRPAHPELLPLTWLYCPLLPGFIFPLWDFFHHGSAPSSENADVISGANGAFLIPSSAFKGKRLLLRFSGAADGVELDPDLSPNEAPVWAGIGSKAEPGRPPSVSCRVPAVWTRTRWSPDGPASLLAIRRGG